MKTDLLLQMAIESQVKPVSEPTVEPTTETIAEFKQIWENAIAYIFPQDIANVIEIIDPTYDSQSSKIILPHAHQEADTDTQLFKGLRPKLRTWIKDTQVLIDVENDSSWRDKVGIRFSFLNENSRDIGFSIFLSGDQSSLVDRESAKKDFLNAILKIVHHIMFNELRDRVLSGFPDWYREQERKSFEIEQKIELLQQRQDEAIKPLTALQQQMDSTPVKEIYCTTNHDMLFYSLKITMNSSNTKIDIRPITDESVTALNTIEIPNGIVTKISTISVAQYLKKIGATNYILRLNGIDKIQKLTAFDDWVSQIIRAIELDYGTSIVFTKSMIGSKETVYNYLHMILGSEAISEHNLKFFWIKKDHSYCRIESPFVDITQVNRNVLIQLFMGMFHITCDEANQRIQEIIENTPVFTNYLNNGVRIDG